MGEGKEQVVVITGPLNDWGRFEREVGEWARKNFGKPGEMSDPILGIVEEIGELQDVGACDSIEKANLMRDAIGDVMVFMADYCSRFDAAIDARSGVDVGDGNLFLEKVIQEANYYYGRLQIDILSAAGRTCHAQLKMGQGVRGSENHVVAMRRSLVEVVCWGMANSEAINKVASAWGVGPMSFGEVVAWVWGRVSKRNWIEDPKFGGEMVAKLAENPDMELSALDNTV